MLIGDKNLPQMWRSIGESALVSRENLAQHVEDWRIVADEDFPAGMVCRERKEEQARDLLRGGVLSEKRRRSPSRPHLDFLAHGRRSDGYMGSLKNERLLIQVRCRSERSSTEDYQMWPIARTEIGPVTISKLNSDQGLPLKS